MRREQGRRSSCASCTTRPAWRRRSRSRPAPSWSSCRSWSGGVPEAKDYISFIDYNVRTMLQGRAGRLMRDAAARRCDDVSLGYDGRAGPRARLASRSSAASSWRCSVRTAPARRRCCAACSGSSRCSPGGSTTASIARVSPPGYVPQRDTLDPIFPLTALEVVLMGTYARLAPLRPVGRRERRLARRLPRAGRARGDRRAAVLGALGRPEAARADRARARGRARAPAPRRADRRRRSRRRGRDHGRRSRGSTASAASRSSW